MENKITSGCGCFEMLAVLTFVAFLVLKLIRIIDWSWWWVTAPLWGYLLLSILVVFVGFGLAMIVVIAKRILHV